MPDEPFVIGPDESLPGESATGGAVRVFDVRDAGDAPPPSAPGAAGWQASRPSDDDRLMAAVAWVSTLILQIPIVSLILLLAEGNRDSSFQRYHAITSIMFWVVAAIYEVFAVVVYIVLGAISLGCLLCCAWVIFFVPHIIALWYALQAYGGRKVEIPLISDFARGQGWV